MCGLILKKRDNFFLVFKGSPYDLAHFCSTVYTALRTSISKYARVVVIFLDVFSLLKNYFLKTTGSKEKVNKKRLMTNT